MKKRWIITYSSSFWCGYELHCVVWARSESEAESLAEYFMQESMYEYSVLQEGESCAPDVCCYTVDSIDLLETSDYWPYFQIPEQQANFYPVINSEN